MVASHAPPTGDLARNLGMCPDGNQTGDLFNLQASAQSTEPHQPRQKMAIFLKMDTVLCALLALNSKVIKVVIGEFCLLGPVRNACVGRGKGCGRSMLRVHCPYGPWEEKYWLSRYPGSGHPC